MGFTPICPKCGSAAIKPRRTGWMECKRCEFIGPQPRFTSMEHHIDGDDVERAKHERAHFIPDRTIKLSDET